MKMASGRRFVGAIRSLVNGKGLQLECVTVLHESLPMPVFMYGSETMIWKEKERSRIRTVHMDNLRGLLTIMKVDKVTNARIRELFGVTKGVDERIDEGVVPRWFFHMERMENDRITKRVYAGQCFGSRSVGRQWKR